MFWGIKESLVLKKQSDPSFKANWDKWGQITRILVKKEFLSVDGNEKSGEIDDSYFDTVVTGNWMDTWDIVEPTNRHIDKYLEMKGLSKSYKRKLKTKRMGK